MPIEDTKMDWNTLYCPNKCCRYYGIPFQPGKMVKNGSSHGQLQALCRGCGGSVALSYATAYYGLESDPALFETAMRALAEGNAECVPPFTRGVLGHEIGLVLGRALRPLVQAYL
jgi:hypothetical protein